MVFEMMIKNLLPAELLSPRSPLYAKNITQRKKINLLSQFPLVNLKCLLIHAFTPLPRKPLKTYKQQFSKLETTKAIA